jgi:hypothetical protein
LPMVRRRLQFVLLRLIGTCPLCRQRIDPGRARDRGGSRV